MGEGSETGARLAAVKRQYDPGNLSPATTTSGRIDGLALRQERHSRRLLSRCQQPGRPAKMRDSPH